MRPRSIIVFERLYLAALVLGVINSALTYSQNLAAIGKDPAAAQMGFGSTFLIATTAFGFGIALLLWYLISRRASTVAKWILTILTGLGLVALLRTIPEVAGQGMVALVLSSVGLVLQLIAIAHLFRADAAAWFASKGRDVPVDPAVFH